MRVHVTGAGGFVGGHLVSTLVEEGHDVVASAQSRRRVPTGDGITPLELDLRGPVDVDVPALGAIVHLAQANMPFPDDARGLLAVNAVATHELLELARRSGATRFVYASSGSVYEPSTERLDESAPLRADDFYSVTKRTGELVLESYASYLTSAVALRLFTPYGPRQANRLVPALVQRIRSGEPITLNDGGRPRLTPVFVGDLVRSVSAALRVDGHHVANVAGDEVVGILELAEKIGAVVGREPLFEQGTQPVAGDLLGSNERMKALLGVDAPVSLDDGLRATVGAETLA